MSAPPPNPELSSPPNKSEGTDPPASSRTRAHLSKGLDPEHIFTVKATDAATNQEVTLQYQALDVSGHGSFGVVLKARLVSGGSGLVALKRTKQDRRYKNRELQIMLAVKHQNIVRLRYYYYEGFPKDDEVYLNLVLDHIPETIYKTYRGYIKRRQQFPEFLIKLYMHQLFRALSYLHAAGVCHRDLKPHNILTDPETGVLTLIDFGSAKVLKPGEPNVSYTCSRYYRAPELIFGSTKYSNAIDLWSTGCILGELLQGSVFFPGTSGIDQLVEIIKVLGTPTREQIKTMNPNYMEHKFPQIKPVPLTRLLPKASPEAISLLQGLLMFDPTARTSACEVMAHPFFDELKVPGKHLPNGMPLPPLFNFSRQELSIRPDLLRRLVPPHVEQQLYDSEQLDLSHFVPIDIAALRVDIE